MGLDAQQEQKAIWFATREKVAPEEAFKSFASISLEKDLRDYLAKYQYNIQSKIGNSTFVHDLCEMKFVACASTMRAHIVIAEKIIASIANL